MPGGGGKGGKGGGEYTFDAAVDPLNIDADVATDMTIGGGERPLVTRMETGGTGTPLATESSVTVGGTETPLSTEVVVGGTGTPVQTGLSFELLKPIETKSTNEATVDVKPLDVDLCLSFGLKELPATRIRRPYHRTFGVRLFGIDVLELLWKGENRLDIEPRPRAPKVAWGGTRERRPTPRRTVATGEGLRISLES